MLPACLVEDPPAYEPPKQTPPRIDNLKTLPRLNEIIVRNSGERIKFIVPVTSEDAGDRLVGTLRVDESGDDIAPAYQQYLAPSTLDDPDERAFVFDVTVPKVQPGCHTYTLRVTHVNNVEAATNRIIDKKDLDEAYWFANIDVKPENSNLLLDCSVLSIGGVVP